MSFFKNKQKAYDNYEDILKKDLNEIDFFELRMAYTRSNYYRPYSRRSGVTELSNLLDEGKYQEVIDKALKLLVPNFVDINFHSIVLSAAEKLNNEKLISFHSFILNKLLKSILNSGDGKTPETAYVVINVDEEYALLSSLGLERIGQFLLNNKQGYDLLIVVDSEGNQSKIYFDVGMPLNWLKKNKAAGSI